MLGRRALLAPSGSDGLLGASWGILDEALTRVRRRSERAVSVCLDRALINVLPPRPGDSASWDGSRPYPTACGTYGSRAAAARSGGEKRRSSPRRGGPRTGPARHARGRRQRDPAGDPSSRSLRCYPAPRRRIGPFDEADSSRTPAPNAVGKSRDTERALSGGLVDRRNPVNQEDQGRSSRGAPRLSPKVTIDFHHEGRTYGF
jgi:hypothetical protein